MLATTNGILWMLTTPWSKDHISYRAYSDIMRPAEERRWAVFHLPSSVSPLITPEFLEEQHRLNGQDVFDREYLANFVDVAGAFFPTALLDKAIHRCEETPCPFCAQYHNPTPGTRLFGGYDPGGKDSYAAFVEIERLDGPKYAIRDCIQDKVKPNEADPRFYTRFTTEIADRHKVLHFTNIGVDTTATQQSINEHMLDLGMRTKGFNFSQAVKEALATRFKINLEQGTLELPDDIVLLSALNCIEAERTPSGGFKFSHRSGTYDDLGWAAMLALAVATEANEPSPGGVILG
jgi:hypothetical protein